ncbi:hypothetical protein IT570_07190 [Candidatus Sumerlaeota bacterium]|nr:hypothetical protein [Candidatus Sumerlaeota bacterium]
MAKAPRHPAASLLIAFLLLLVTSRLAAMEMTGVDLVTTSGTLELQRVSAAEAVLSDDGVRIDTKELTLSLRLGENRNVSAKAPEGIIIVGGEENNSVSAAKGSEKTSFKQMMAYGDDFLGHCGPGDLLLDGKGQPTVARFGDDGEVSSDKLIWSDKLAKFILPGQFKQSGHVTADTHVNVTGAAVAIDQAFRNWTYYGDETNPAVIVWERKAAPDAPAPTTTTAKDGKNK